MLYRSVDFVGDPRHAERETGWRALYTIGQCESLQDIRQVGTPDGLREIAAQPGDVR